MVVVVVGGVRVCLLWMMVAGGCCGVDLFVCRLQLRTPSAPSQAKLRRPVPVNRKKGRRSSIREIVLLLMGLGGCDRNAVGGLAGNGRGWPLAAAAALLRIYIYSRRRPDGDAHITCFAAAPPLRRLAARSWPAPNRRGHRSIALLCLPPCRASIETLPRLAFCTDQTQHPQAIFNPRGTAFGHRSSRPRWRRRCSTGCRSCWPASIATACPCTSAPRWGRSWCCSS